MFKQEELLIQMARLVDKRIRRLEQIVFLLIETRRTEIIATDRLDSDDKKQIQDFYDELRNQGR